MQVFLITAILLIIVLGFWALGIWLFRGILLEWSGDRKRPVSFEVWLILILASSPISIVVIRIIHQLVSSL